MRGETGYPDPHALWRRGALGRGALERLAEADAFRSVGLDRRRALWALKALGEPPLPLFAAAETSKEKPSPPNGGRGQGEGGFSGACTAAASEARAMALLPEMPLGEQVVEDYASLGLSLKRHPLAFLRSELAGEGLVTAADLAHLPVDRRLAIAGIVLIRQRPGSANGVVFITIEDETGIANLIVWPAILERFRRAALGATLLRCTGKLQREQSVIHVVAERLADMTPRLNTLRDHTGDAEPPVKLPSKNARQRRPRHRRAEPQFPLIAGLRCRSLGSASLSNRGARERVGPFVFGVTGMAAHPFPSDLVALCGGVEPLPQIDILDRLFVGGPPAALFPGVDPLGDAVAQILAVAEEPHPARALQGLQPRNGRHHLHAVVGGERLEPAQLLFDLTIAQDRGPAARTGIAAAGAVGKDLDLGRLGPADLRHRDRNLADLPTVR